MNTRSIAVALVAGVVALNVAAATLSTPPVHAQEGDVSLTCFPHAPTSDLRFDNTWGAARSDGRGHKGTDIMSPKGLEVLAVADGTVAGLENGPRSGYYVRLVHDGGWESWYMHLANDTPGTDDGRGGPETAFAPSLEIGDRVRAGDVIGYVGDSGNAEWAGSHTHFELHIDGGAVNPYPFLVDVAARVDRLYEIATPLVVAPPPYGQELQIDRGPVWGELLASGGVNCLSSAYQNAIEHVFGELPGEGVLLTGVKAR